MRVEITTLAAAIPLLGCPHYSVRDAVVTEWRRQAPSITEEEMKALPEADRKRLELSIQRIGAPDKQGVLPKFTPSHIENPTAEYWEKKAKEAKTHLERFTAFYFLNRLKHPNAFMALEGLNQDDAQHWPATLHLEGHIATARINAKGTPMPKSVEAFQAALQACGKLDPVRLQAAQMRLLNAGLEKELLPAVKATPGGMLTLLDAWNQRPWEARRDAYAKAIRALTAQDAKAFPWEQLGLHVPEPDVFQASQWGIRNRIFGGLPEKSTESAKALGEAVTLACQDYFKTLNPLTESFAPDHLPVLESLRLFSCPESLALAKKAMQSKDCRVHAAILPVLRARSAQDADQLRNEMLEGEDPVSRATAIADLVEAPKGLESLIQSIWCKCEMDGAQEVINGAERWKLPQEEQKQLFTRFLQHPIWTVRLEAFNKLRALNAKDPKAVNALWPKVPCRTREEKHILRLAIRLAKRQAPVRLAFHFEGGQRVIFKLDPTVAPINVANLLHLAQNGWFNGRRIGRVVPDFVLQMGSPYDTMNGGSPTIVRCENSHTPYTPGSIGMALSTKDSGSSQIFITLNAAVHLSTRYTRVGEVENPEITLPMLDEMPLGARIEYVERVK